MNDFTLGLMNFEFWVKMRDFDIGMDLDWGKLAK